MAMDLRVVYCDWVSGEQKSKSNIPLVDLVCAIGKDTNGKTFFVVVEIIMSQATGTSFHHQLGINPRLAVYQVGHIA